MTCGRSLPGEGLSLLGFFDMATAVSSIHTSRLPRLADFGGQWPVLARGTPRSAGQVTLFGSGEADRREAGSDGERRSQDAGRRRLCGAARDCGRALGSCGRRRPPTGPDGAELTSSSSQRRYWPRARRGRGLRGAASQRVAAGPAALEPPNSASWPGTVPGHPASMVDTKPAAAKLASMPLITFGHGTASAERIAELLGSADVSALVDVRIAPGSRRHPHVARAEMERWLPEHGVSYRGRNGSGASAGRRRIHPTWPGVSRCSGVMPSTCGSRTS